MSRRDRRFRGAHGDSASGLLYSLFFLGIIIGTVVAYYVPSAVLSSELSRYVSGGVATGTFLSSVYNAVLFIILVLLLGTSFLGVFLIPVTVLLKAFTMSFSVAVMYLSDSRNGLLCAIFSIGLPSMILIPCFLVSAVDALRSSRELYAQRFHSEPCGRNTPNLYRHVLFVLAGALLAAVYDHYCLPLILSHTF